MLLANSPQICLIVVAVYIKKFAHEAHPGVAPRFVSGLTCTIVLITALLLPVDVFMTSYQKYPNGTWRVSNSSTITSAIFN